MAAATFDNEDEEAQYCLSLLRDGTPSEKVGAREQLAAIFTRRGLYLEATELYEANVRAGVHEPGLFERLSDSYRRIGDNGAAEAALAEACRLRDAARPRPVAPAPPPSMPASLPTPALPPTPNASAAQAYVPSSASRSPSASPVPAAPKPAAPASQSSTPAIRPAAPMPDSDEDRGNGRVIQFPAPATGRLPTRPVSIAPPADTARMPAPHSYDADSELLIDEPAAAQRPRRRRGLTVPGPLLVLGIVVFLIVLPVVTLALLVVNPLALYLEGRPAGPTVNVTASAPPRLKVAAGTAASWYVESGRSVSGLWATPGLELTLDQELDGAGTTFAVTAPRSQSWGETITIVERRGQGRSNQETVLLATFAAPSALPPSGTVIEGRIAGQVTAPRLSESSQFNTTTEGIDVPVQLVVVSAPELWLDRFWNSLRMFFLDDRWLLVTIGALLTWCVLAGGTAILFRVRPS